jgi:hypothetical protein
MSIPQAQSLIKGADFYNLVFQLPKGLTLSQNAGGIYNAATGELVIAHLRTTGNSARLHLGIAAVNMNQASATYDRDASTVTVAEQVYLKSGSVTIADADVLSTLPSSMKLRLDYNLSDIDITAFSGEINYQIEGATVPAVNLSSLPDIFSKSGTDIVLRNPRIYLNLSNPLQGYGLTERSGMTLTPMRGNVTGTPCSLDAATPYIVIGTDQPGAEYQYCLSPEPVATPDSEFPSAAHVGFKSLSALLSGDGLPSSVNIDLTNPCVPQQTVANLPLGINLGAVGGTYKYVAPFEFAEGSQIVYTRTLSGWNGEDVDQITITALEVSADVTTNMPLRLTLTGFPIDVDGNQINDVEIVGADLDANASSQHVTLKITGEVRHLDGLKFKAVATAGETTATLAPSMTIDLKNIRPVATGYYIKKL